MEIKKITQEDINRTVWKACDTFRGVIDPSQYKDYILTMLFIKYVSDVYKSKLNDYLTKYDGDKERSERAMRHERFVVPEKSSFDFLYNNRNIKMISYLAGITWIKILNIYQRELIISIIEFTGCNIEALCGRITLKCRFNALSCTLCKYTAFVLPTAYINIKYITGIISTIVKIGV